MIDRTVSRLLFLAGVVAAITAAGCSSTAEGEVKCTGGVCEPKPVFATGHLSSVLVTSSAVYAAERTVCGIYMATKPLKTANLLARDACSVSGFALAGRTLFWTTTPLPKSDGGEPNGTLAFVAELGASSTIVDAALEHPRGIAVLGGDTVYVAVKDGIRTVAPGRSKLERVLDLAFSPETLHAFGDALYFHDGLSTIYAWRPGDAKPTRLVENANVMALYESHLYRSDAFAVDASGIYWLSQTPSGAGALNHAPLAGGKAEEVLALKGFPKALALDDGAVYWSEADSFIVAKNTTINRSLKSALGTFSVIGAIVGEVDALQSMPEGLYVAASPSLTDLDVSGLGFRRYGGPLLILPRGVLDSR